EVMAVVLKIGPDEGIGFAIEGFYVLEPSRARNLLREDAMELGIDTMRFDRGGDNRAHRGLNRLRGDLRQRATGDPHRVLTMTIDDGGNDGLFAREILVGRDNAHARHLR